MIKNLFISKIKHNLYKFLKLLPEIQGYFSFIVKYKSLQLFILALSINVKLSLSKGHFSLHKEKET